MIFRILALGDVAGPLAVKRIREELSGIREELNADFVVCNGENSAASNGIDIQSANSLFQSGVDAITTGNHTFKRREIREYLDYTRAIVRPGNFPPDTSGRGYTILYCKNLRILVMNVLGVIYLEPLACPFFTVDRMLRGAEGKYDISILDIHAEATSEKIAMSHYFDGRVDIIFGTHTHVQTADERIMHKGTAYITDLGMCGPDDSVLGIKTENIIEKLTTHMPVKFDFSENHVTLHGAVFDYDTDLKKVVKVQRFER